jgi:hypothetical protein
MTAGGNPDGCGRICQEVIPRLLLEIACVRARAEPRVLTPCELCGASNPIVLGRGCSPFRCYRHRVRATEAHHPRAGHSGPPIPGTDGNEHRVVSEAERIWRRVAHPALCLDCALGCNRFLVVRLCSLGTLGG